MAVTETLYTGNGVQTTYTITFPYLEASDVKASLNGTPTTAFTFPTSTTLQFNVAPGNGVAIRIFRDTDDSALDATFSPDSSLRATDLNGNFTKLLYVVQESDDKSDLVAGAVADAEQALTLATAADANATAALAAVSAVVPVNDVAAVANIPGSPTNGEVVRVINSTGIQSFSPLSGLPGGFVGESGLAVTITWDGSTWNYIRYEPNDPDVRYVQDEAGSVGSTELATGAVTTVKIADDAVTAAKIADNAVVGSTIADNQITVSKLFGGPVNQGIGFVRSLDVLSDGAGFDRGFFILQDHTKSATERILVCFGRTQQSASTTALTTETFATAFKTGSEPTVVATVGGVLWGFSRFVSINDITATGFEYQVRDDSNTPQANRVFYIAIGQASDGI